MPPEILRLLMGPTPGPAGAPQPQSLPPGVEGAADQEPFPQKGAAAPGLPGMAAGKLGKASDIDSQIGGVIAAQLRKAARRYHEKRAGPKTPSGR